MEYRGIIKEGATAIAVIFAVIASSFFVIALTA